MSTNLRPLTTAAGPTRALSPLARDGQENPVDALGRAGADREQTGGCELSVVIPTRNESGNIAELLRRLDVSLDRICAEAIFVDDSDDSTPDRIMEQEGRHPYLVRLLHRNGMDRSGGLGSAVLVGLSAANAPWVVVMDGDLQHPPEVVPLLVAAGREAAADLVVATRYLGAGSATGLDGRLRALVSRVCTVLTRMSFPTRLSGVSDPMSGFFAVRPAALEIDTLRPTGYKILLEIVARSPALISREVPFSFHPRFSGESKASLREGVTFARRLAALRLVAWTMDARNGPAHLLRGARLLFPLLVTLLAFPNVVWLIRSAGNHRALVGPLTCLIAALVVATGRLRPWAGEPDVHDRQADIIFAVPVLALAAWLKLGWSSSIGLHTRLSNHEVVAAVACLCGVYLVTLGTRTTARLGLPLVLLLTASPALSSHRVIPVLVSAVAAIAVLSSLRRRHRASAAGPANAHLEHSAGRIPRQAERWPTLRVGTTAVAVVAFLLVVDDCRLELRTPRPPAAAANSLKRAVKLASGAQPSRPQPFSAATSGPETHGRPDKREGSAAVPSASPTSTPLLGPVIIPRVLNPTKTDIHR